MNSFRDSGASGQAAPDPYVAPRRDGHRQPLAAGEARLLVGRRGYVVDVLNISGGGAMIRTNLPLKLWSSVNLELAEGGSVECAVRWIKGDRICLEFAHETQVAGDAARRDAMLLDTIERHFSGLADTPSATDPDEPRRRAELRHPLVWSGELVRGDERTRVRLRNISASGAMVDSPNAFAEGAEVLLDLGAGGRHGAFVTWSRGDQLGLRFQRPFDIACLASAEPELAPWAEPWERMSLSELRDRLEGFLKP